MAYIPGRVYTEEELGLSGVLDKLKSGGGTVWDWIKTGAKQDILGTKTAPPPAYTPPPATFMDKYGPFLLIGGAGLVVFLIVRKKK